MGLIDRNKEDKLFFTKEEPSAKERIAHRKRIELAKLPPGVRVLAEQAEELDHIFPEEPT